LKATAIAKRYRDSLPLPGIHLNPVAYFKWHWPRFEAEVQYYELRYEAERCRPEQDGKTWADFWLEEISRLRNEINAHPELYAYYQAQRIDQDEQYFGGDPAVARENADCWASFIAVARYEQDLKIIFTQFLDS
ncbi:MAG TPA: RteC domain-containing protein, partial [Puia sp.]|nr:RteC domain-containing protein [Puia sp.]